METTTLEYPEQNKTFLYYPELNDSKGNIFILAGKFATGKSTLAKSVEKLIPDLNRLVTYTSRPPRDGEVDGVDYNFVPEREFLRGQYIAVERYKNWTYGIDPIDLLPFKEYLVVATPSGCRELKLRFGDRVTIIYLMSPAFDRMERYLSRDKDSAELRKEMLRRFQTDETDFYEFEYEADYLVVNKSDFSETLSNVCNIIDKVRGK